MWKKTVMNQFRILGASQDESKEPVKMDLRMDIK